MKVFLDTNVLVSAVATRGICADILQVVVAEHELVLGETVLGELRRVLGEKLGLPADLVEETEEFLRRESSVIAEAVPLGIEVCDEDDVALLEEAVAGAVHVLVTGDQDLLDIAKQAPIEIVNPRGFWDQLRSEGPPKE